MTSMRAPRLHIAKDGTKTWQVRYREGGRNSRERSETFTRERDARTFSRMLADYGPTEALAVLASQQGIAEHEHTVASWCTEHVDHLAGVTSGTIRDYRRYIARDLGKMGELPLTALTPRAVAGWVAGMDRTGAAGKTIANKHGFLSACMSEAVTAGLIPTNPCKGTRIPRSVVAPMVFLSHEEYTRFLSCFTPRWQPLVEVLFATGMRWGEVSALQVGDVDLAAGTISITRAWKRGDGKPELGAPKSRRSRRTIAIAPETAAVLRPLMDGRPGDAWVFVNERGGHVRGPAFHTTAWQPAVRLANGEIPYRSTGRGQPPRVAEAARHLAPLSPALGKRPRIHDARHSCASWLLGAGIPINVVSAHLGHENITTTVDRYGHLLPSAQAYVREALSAALSQSVPELLPGG